MRILIILSTLLTGLSAGFFITWSVSVLPGLSNLSDEAFIRSMQSINRYIQNPVFFIIFIGPMVLLSVVCYQFYQLGHLGTFKWILIALILYVIGVFGVTVIGNVPLNNKLDKVGMDVSSTELTAERVAFEQPWNKYHYIRTVMAILAFACITIAITHQQQ